MVSFFSQKKTKQIISGLLAVWLSGFVLLFCCGAMQTTAANEICPLAKAGNHCDKTKSKSNSPTFSSESDNQNFDCCAFLPALFEKTRKLEKTQQTAQISDKLKFDAPRFSFAENNFQVAETYQPPDFYQEKIFIKNCVFRI